MARIEKIIDIRKTANDPHETHAQVLRCLLEAGMPIQQHFYHSAKGMTEHFISNLQHGKLLVEPFDFRTAVRFVWTDK